MVQPSKAGTAAVGMLVVGTVVVGIGIGDGVIGTDAVVGHGSRHTNAASGQRSGSPRAMPTSVATKTPVVPSRCT